MNIESIPVETLSQSELFTDYLTNFNALNDFYESNPFDDVSLKKKLSSYKFSGNRDQTVHFLIDYNSQFGAGNSTLNSIEKLRNPESVAFVTGQQLTVFGGPLFTIYKILTTIVYSKKWEEESGIPVVPVFWMADEDHDYDEAASIGLLVNDEHQTFELEGQHNNGRRVFNRLLSDRIKSLLTEVSEAQYDTDFSDKLSRVLSNAYKPENTFGIAFGKLLLELFGHHGLVLAGSNSKIAKELIKEELVRSVKKSQDHFSALKSVSDQLLERNYHNQVYVQESNLFWLDDEGNRLKLHAEDGAWFVDSGNYSKSASELMGDIEKNPDRFSPNVFLRPVIQNKLIPGFAYIAGPGETAYYAQMKKYFTCFDLRMPVIIPRFSVTLMESSIERIFDKLPFRFSDYQNRIEDLEAMYIEKSESPNVEKIFGRWKNRVIKASEESIETVGEIDPTLKGSARKAVSLFENELDKVKGKVYRSIKDTEKTQLNRITKIKNSLFPNRNLQEREIAFIYFMNKYGFTIWDDILEHLQGQIPDSHKLIHL